MPNVLKMYREKKGEIRKVKLLERVGVRNDKEDSVMCSCLDVTLEYISCIINNNYYNEKCA